jgi:NAD(P)-dependent dehydrogenase (short-subunit alcohol dehydrogenase family)
MSDPGGGGGAGDARRQDLAGQVALVTGGGRGLGRAIAIGLASVGMAVAVTARSADQLDETVAAVEGSGGRALALPADVTDQAAVQRIVSETEQRLGPIDLLVNNAGRGQPIGLTWEIDPADWWRTLEVNLLGPLLYARAVLPGMVARGTGRIVNMASGAGLGTGRHFSAYATSKAALIRLSEALAAEAGAHGVRVFAIAPGVVQTAMVVEVLESATYSQLLPGIPDAVREGRDVPPERAAQLVVCLASGAADGLNGRYLGVQDDLPALIARAEEIQRDRLHTLRLAT